MFLYIKVPSTTPCLVMVDFFSTCGSQIGRHITAITCVNFSLQYRFNHTLLIH
uniref:Uncharacterized protein n=1 Tax=Anguilla anguilla TaxID=7936 RepID=A0A0E9WQR8_ANGAN